MKNPLNTMDNRAYQAGEGMTDSDGSIRRAGGDDPRRHDASIVIDRKVRDHDQSGYNHAYTPKQKTLLVLLKRKQWVWVRRCLMACTKNKKMGLNDPSYYSFLLVSSWTGLTTSH